MANLTHSTFAADFSAKVRRSLLKSGIRIVGITALPIDGSFLNSQRGYQLDDNGTSRIRTYFQVEAMGGEDVPARFLA